MSCISCFAAVLGGILYFLVMRPPLWSILSLESFLAVIWAGVAWSILRDFSCSMAAAAVALMWSGVRPARCMRVSVGVSAVHPRMILAAVASLDAMFFRLEWGVRVAQVESP